MRIGVLGTGKIAGILSETFAGMQEAERYAVASRTLEKAKAFAETYGYEKAYGSYLDLILDEKVELIYIATPHSDHFGTMKLCITHGKPVLCEKSFTLNADQAKEIFELAKEKKVYVAEAIWTRYMPSRKMINELLQSGVIGNVRTLTANLSYVIAQKARIIEPQLAGGALLDIGIYGLNFAFMHFGTEIERIESAVQMTETGVDGMETITIFYKNGRMAVLTHSIYERSDRKGIFHGDKGYMIIENINNPQSISIYNLNDELIKEIKVPKQINGYEYEVAESIACIQNGQTESTSMPWKDTVYVLEIMDSIRKKWGLQYPGE